MKKAGFTILEILMAVTILVIVVSIIYSTYASTTGVINECRQKVDLNYLAGTILDRMSEEISSAYYIAESGVLDFRGEDYEENGLETDRLNFVCLLPLRNAGTNAEWSLTEVGYYIKKKNDTLAGSLLRRTSSEVDKNVETGGLSRVLSRSVKVLSLEYFDGSQWQKEWRSRMEKGLPRAVRIYLVLEKDGRELELETVVYLTMSSV